MIYFTFRIKPGTYCYDLRRGIKKKMKHDAKVSEKRCANCDFGKDDLQMQMYSFKMNVVGSTSLLQIVEAMIGSKDEIYYHFYLLFYNLHLSSLCDFGKDDLQMQMRTVHLETASIHTFDLCKLRPAQSIYFVEIGRFKNGKVHLKVLSNQSDPVSCKMSQSN